MGDATITASFPPQNYNSNWIKCTKDNQFAVIEGVNNNASVNNTQQRPQYTTTTQTQTIYTVKKQRGGFTFGPVGVKFNF